MEQLCACALYSQAEVPRRSDLNLVAKTVTAPADEPGVMGGDREKSERKQRREREREMERRKREI